jgi:hypothetical protein
MGAPRSGHGEMLVIKLKKAKGRGKRAIPKRRKFPRNPSGMLRVEIERKKLVLKGIGG